MSQSVTRSIPSVDVDKSLPVFYPEGFRYECICCGECCSGWSILASKNVYEKLAGTENYRRWTEELQGIPPFLYNSETGCYETVKKSGRCGFQMDNGLCRIHGELGLEAKPLVCRYFPVTLTSTPDGTYVGMSFVCPAVQRKLGKPLEESLGDLKEWKVNKRRDFRNRKRVKITEKISVEWRTYKLIESFVIDMTGDSQDLKQAFWDCLMAVAGLALELENRGECSDDDLFVEDYLDRQIEIVWPQNDQYNRQEKEFAITFLNEIQEKESFGVIREDNERKACAGGHREDAPGGISLDYKASNRTASVGYFQHVIWRKFLLKGENCIQSLTALSLIQSILDLYYYNLFLSNPGRGPGEMMEKSLARIEKIVLHSDLELGFSFLDGFCRNIYRFAALSYNNMNITNPGL